MRRRKCLNEMTNSGINSRSLTHYAAATGSTLPSPDTGPFIWPYCLCRGLNAQKRSRNIELEKMRKEKFPWD